MIEHSQILKSSKSKRVYIIFSILLTFFWLAILFLIDKYFKYPAIFLTILREVLIDLIATTITASIIFGLILFLLPFERKYSEVIITEPRETKVLCKNALQETDVWYHNGHIGRWVRTEAFPILAKRSKDLAINVDSKLLILNPSNSALLNSYLNYRKSLSFNDKSITDIEDIKAELYTTILLALLYNNDKSNSLNVEIYLREEFSQMREDISSKFALISHIDPRAHSLLYLKHNVNRSSSLFYNTSVSNFLYSISKINSIKFFQTKEENISIIFIKEILCLYFPTETFSDKLCKKILILTKSDYHPYK